MVFLVFKQYVELIFFYLLMGVVFDKLICLNLFQGVEGKYLFVKFLKDKYSVRSFIIDKILGNVICLL